MFFQTYQTYISKAPISINCLFHWSEPATDPPGILEINTMVTQFANCQCPSESLLSGVFLPARVKFYGKIVRLGNCLFLFWFPRRNKCWRTHNYNKTKPYRGSDKVYYWWVATKTAISAQEDVLASVLVLSQPICHSVPAAATTHTPRLFYHHVGSEQWSRTQNTLRSVQGTVWTWLELLQPLYGTNSHSKFTDCCYRFAQTKSIHQRQHWCRNWHCLLL